MYRYHYSFSQKVMFMLLWLLGSLFVAVNFFSSPILSISHSAYTLSLSVTILQTFLLLTLWFFFIRARRPIGRMLRWMGLGIIVLPYLIQIGLLSYITL